MAKFTDNFTGAPGALLSVRPGWAKTHPQRSEYFAIGASGGLDYLGGANGTAIVHDIGDSRHKVTVTLGAGFFAAGNAVQVVVGGIITFRLDPGQAVLAYEISTSRRANVGSDWVAGDTLIIEFDKSAKTLVVWKNATKRHTDSLAVFDLTLATALAGFTSSYSGGAAATDVFRSFEVETLAPEDKEAPVLPGAITVGARTTTTIATSCPSATDNIGVVKYNVRINGSAWLDKGLSQSHTHTALTPGVDYVVEWSALDAMNNRSNILGVITKTFGSGATANTVRLTTGPQDGNPAGFLYALAGTVSPGDWLSYDIVSGPTPAGGTLTASPTGAFTYVGPTPATLLLQPQVNGVDVEQITVTLYESSGNPTGRNLAVTPAISNGAIVQGASVPLSGARYAVTPGYTSGSLVQAAAVLLAGTGLAVVPAISRGGIVQDAVLALHGASMAATPALSSGAILEVAQPNYRSMAPSPVCAVYLRDSYRVHNFNKTAGEVLDFDIDFRHELRSTQDSARATGTVEIDPGPGVVKVLGVYWVPELQRIKLWLSGGRSQNVADLTVWLNTTAGRRLQADVRVYIK